MVQLYKGKVVKEEVVSDNVSLTLVQSVFNRFMWYLKKDKQFMENSVVYPSLGEAQQAFGVKKIELAMKGYK